MAKVKILGSSYAAPNTKHENTHFALQGSHGNILVDCGANPTVRLEAAGIFFDSIDHVIFTHFHPDHVGGAPLLLLNMWMMGRTKPLNIYGLGHCLRNLQILMEMYEWKMWPNFFPVNWHAVPDGEDQPVFDGEDFHITGWPATHFVPTLGLRIRDKSAGRVLACATTPTTAFKLGEKMDDPLTMYLSDVFTLAVNLAGLPAISLPCGLDAGGLPIGLQLIGPALSEVRLLQVAQAYEQAAGWQAPQLAV